MVSAGHGGRHPGPAVCSGERPNAGSAHRFDSLTVEQREFGDAVTEVASLRTHTAGHEGRADLCVLVAGEIGAEHLKARVESVRERAIELFQRDCGARADRVRFAVDDDFIEGECTYIVAASLRHARVCGRGEQQADHGHSRGRTCLQHPAARRATRQRQPINLVTVSRAYRFNGIHEQRSRQRIDRVGRDGVVFTVNQRCCVRFQGGDHEAMA